jgi:hypothetical protein
VIGTALFVGMPFAAAGIFFIVAEWTMPLGIVLLLMSGIPLYLVNAHHIRQKVHYQSTHEEAMPNEEEPPWVM